MKIVVIPDVTCIPAAAIATLTRRGLNTPKAQARDFPRLGACRHLTAYYFECVGKRFVLKDEEIGTINEVATGEYDEARGMWTPRMLVQVDWDKVNIAERLIAPGAQLRVAQRTIMQSIDALRKQAILAMAEMADRVKSAPVGNPGDIIPTDGLVLVEIKITDALRVEVLEEHAETAEALASTLRGMIEEDDDAIADATK